MDNYRTIETRLARLEPFKGNSSHAEWITAKDGTPYQKGYKLSNFTNNLVAYLNKQLESEGLFTEAEREQILNSLVIVLEANKEGN